MTFVLNTQIEKAEQAPEAANGRFFVPEYDELRLFDLEVASGPDGLDDELHQLITSQTPSTRAALSALDKMRKVKDVIKLASEVEGLVSEEVLEEARLDSIDQGAVWRSATDTISNTIARRFPNQVLSHPIFDTEEAVHLTSEHRIYRIEPDLSVWVFASFSDQSEMDEGIKLATEEMWEELLFNMSMAAVLRPGQSHS